MWARYHKVSRRGNRTMYTKMLYGEDEIQAYREELLLKYNDVSFRPSKRKRFPTFEEYFAYETREPRSRDPFVNQARDLTQARWEKQEQERRIARFREMFPEYV